MRRHVEMTNVSDMSILAICWAFTIDPVCCSSYEYTVSETGPTSANLKPTGRVWTSFRSYSDVEELWEESLV